MLFRISIIGYLLIYLLIRKARSSEDTEPLFRRKQELTPKLYRVIERNDDDVFEVEEGWRRLNEESSLYSNEEFLEHLNCSFESLTNESSAIVESKVL